MKIFLQVLKWISISIFGILIIVISAFFVYDCFFYNREMNQIKKDLNKISNVKVLKIWGHEDVTLEEVSTRLKIKNKGEIVLYGLSEDVFNYPENVFVSEIGGYSFTVFFCDGSISSNLNIGTGGEIFPLINKEFKTVEDVVTNYDFILMKIEGLKKYPEINHFKTENSEYYISIHCIKSVDQDPICNLVDVESPFEYAKKLKWNNSDCH